MYTLYVGYIWKLQYLHGKNCHGVHVFLKRDMYTGLYITEIMINDLNGYALVHLDYFRHCIRLILYLKILMVFSTYFS